MATDRLYAECVLPVGVESRLLNNLAYTVPASHARSHIKRRRMQVTGFCRRTVHVCRKSWHRDQKTPGRCSCSKTPIHGLRWRHLD